MYDEIHLDKTSNLFYIFPAHKTNNLLTIFYYVCP
jgi:hypothetical protein